MRIFFKLDGLKPDLFDDMLSIDAKDLPPGLIDALRECDLSSYAIDQMLDAASRALTVEVLMKRVMSADESPREPDHGVPRAANGVKRNIAKG